MPKQVDRGAAMAVSKRQSGTCIESPATYAARLGDGWATSLL